MVQSDLNWTLMLVHDVCGTLSSHVICPMRLSYEGFNEATVLCRSLYVCGFMNEFLFLKKKNNNKVNSNYLCPYP